MNGRKTKELKQAFIELWKEIFPSSIPTGSSWRKYKLEYKRTRMIPQKIGRYKKTGRIKNNKEVYKLIYYYPSPDIKILS